MLLRQLPAFRRLWVARAISSFGDGVSFTALTLLFLPDGAGTVALVLLAGSLPRLLGPVTGVLADRLAVRPVLIGSACFGGGCLLVLAATEPPTAVVLCLVALAALAATVFGPAFRRAVPEFVPAGRLPEANALNAMAQQLALTLGAALGGALVAASSPRSALLLDAATFAAAAVLLCRVPRINHTGDGDVRRVGADILEGLVTAATTPVLRSLLLTMVVLIAFAGVDNLALVFLVEEDLGAGDVAYALMSAVFGLSLFLTSFALRHSTTAPGRLLFLSILMSALGPCVCGLAPGLEVLAVGAVLGGAGNALVVLAADGLLQRAVPRPLLGRVGGAYQACTQLGMALAYAGGGLLVGFAGARPAFLVAAAGSLLALSVARAAVRTDLPLVAVPA